MSRRRTARPPRTKPPAERRAELMDAAQRLFLAQGFAPTSIEQVTTTAGVAKGTFYLYFSSKEAVRSALGERYGEAHLARASAAVGQARAWEEKLLAWVQASADFSIRSPCTTCSPTRRAPRPARGWWRRRSPISSRR
jgi:AcrR family transcriptional regulator